MDTRVEALVSLLEDLERLERHMLHLVDTNDACAIETRAYLAEQYGPDAKPRRKPVASAKE
jgi:hypothetical protein